MSDAPHVRTAIEDGIATLTLVNRARRNAVSAVMWQQIADFAAMACQVATLRVVLVRGDGNKAFSAGADISDFAALRAEPRDAKVYDELVEATCRAVEAIPQPTIALIEGACIGAGASLAAACDMRIATRSSFFAVPAARLGLGYDPAGVARFLRVFGLSATRHLLFSADRIGAARAYELAAIDALAEDGALDGAAGPLARRIAGNAPLTVQAAKLAIRAQAVDADLMAEAVRLASRADASADYREGRQAFAAKRSPHFTGS